MNITAVIRLNEPLYDKNIFNQHGITVYDLEYEDGTCPNNVNNWFI